MIKPKTTPHKNRYAEALAGPNLALFLFMMAAVSLVAVNIERPDDAVLEMIAKWQTLLAGFCALLAAAYAGTIVRLQIGQADAVEAARMDRDLRASRVVLPLTLSLLSEYVGALGRAAKDVVAASATEKAVLSSGVIPALDAAPAAVADLQRFVQAAPADLGEVIAGLLPDVQILRSIARDEWATLASSDVGSVAFKATFEALIIRVALVQAQIAQLWPYARRETDAAPTSPERSDYEQALRLMGLERDVDPRVFAILDSKLSGGFLLATPPQARVSVV